MPSQKHVAEPTRIGTSEQPLSRMSRRSRKAGVEATKAEASKGRRRHGRAKADVAVETDRRHSSVQCPWRFLLC